MTPRERPAGDVLRLYAHVPFCNYTCNFCFYAIKVGARREQMERYVAALERELEWIEPVTNMSQLYVGGGTPTSLPSDLLDRLLSAVFTRTKPCGSGVHTVEASPESISAEHVRVLKQQGVGRVSMGIQSLDDRILTRVQRRHTAQQALEACRNLVDSGLILNVDLIYGLPGQSEASFRHDLESLAEAVVQWVTLYNLRLNEGTLAALIVADDERLELARLMRWRAFVKQEAIGLGFTQTRWHTFKRLDSIAARHERLPCFDDKTVKGYQLGVGMSARSHLGSAVYRNHKDFNVYLERVEQGKSPVEETFVLVEADRKTQFIARSLGDGKPLERQAYARAFGSDIEDDFGDLLARLCEVQLIEEYEGRLFLSEIGQLVYDVITLAFYPDHTRAWMEKRQHVKLGGRRSLAP